MTLTNHDHFRNLSAFRFAQYHLPVCSHGVYLGDPVSCTECGKRAEEMELTGAQMRELADMTVKITTRPVPVETQRAITAAIREGRAQRN